MLSDFLCCVNSRQEGKLTYGAGNRDGKAKGMSRSPRAHSIGGQHKSPSGGLGGLGRCHLNEIEYAPKVIE